MAYLRLDVILIFAQEDELVQADIVIDDLMELKGILLKVQNTHATN